MLEMYKEIGKALRKMRQANGWTGSEVGEVLGVSKACIHFWETGKRRIDLDDLEAYCAIFGVDPMDILDGNGLEKLNRPEDAAQMEWQMIASFPDGSDLFVTNESLNEMLTFVAKLNDCGMLEDVSMVYIQKGEKEEDGRD